MAKESNLKRGFKAKAERLAIHYRKQLTLHAWDPLCAFKLAENLQISIYDIREFVKDSTQLSLVSGNGGTDSEWSALTMVTSKGNRIIIHNGFHSPQRQQSNIMHELAHVICEHELKEVVTDFSIPIGMRFFDDEQEEEASCLGSTLQLAKPGLLWSRKRSMTYDEIATHFNASLEMVTYRMNITGVAKIKN